MKILDEKLIQDYAIPQQICGPILQAKQGQGVFGVCQGMGADELTVCYSYQLTVFKEPRTVAQVAFLRVKKHKFGAQKFN